MVQLVLSEAASRLIGAGSWIQGSVRGCVASVPLLESLE